MIDVGVESLSSMNRAVCLKLPRLSHSLSLYQSTDHRKYGNCSVNNIVILTHFVINKEKKSANVYCLSSF